MLRELEAWEIEDVIGGENIDCIGLGSAVQYCVNRDTGKVTLRWDLVIWNGERTLGTWDSNKVPDPRTDQGPLASWDRQLVDRIGTGGGGGGSVVISDR